MNARLALVLLSLAALPATAVAAPKAGRTVEVSIRSSPGPVCRAMRSTFVVDPAKGPDSVPTLSEPFTPPVELSDPSCGVHVAFRDDTRRVNLALGDGGHAILDLDAAAASRGRTFRAVDRSVQLRGEFGNVAWKTDLSPEELASVGVAALPANFLDLSSFLPVVVRVRRCVGAVCEAYHQVDTAAAAPTCTPGLELRLVDDAFAVTDPSLQRCLPESDGVALAVFPTPSSDRAHTLSVSVPGYDLPALLVQLPRTEAALLSVDVRVQQDP